MRSRANKEVVGGSRTWTRSCRVGGLIGGVILLFGQTSWVFPSRLSEEALVLILLVGE